MSAAALSIAGSAPRESTALGTAVMRGQVRQNGRGETGCGGCCQLRNSPYRECRLTARVNPAG